MIELFIALAIIIGTTYYFVVYKKQEQLREEEKKKRLKEENLKREEERRELEKELKKKNQRKKQPAKKVKKPAENKAHDPSNHPKYIRKFGGHHGDIISISLSPNGEWMATSGNDGQLRVARVEKDNPHMFVKVTIPDHDKIDHVCWEGDNRTIACVLHRKQEVTFYRVRKKKDADIANAGANSFPYELFEMVKRKFKTESKLDTITSLVTDQSSAVYNLILTSGESSAKNSKVVVAWDGSKTGDFLSLLTTGAKSSNGRVSKDGRFICGRSAGAGKEVKVFEIIKKRHKGEVDPQFDSLPTKSVMSMAVGKDLSDVDFLYSHGSESRVCDKAVLGCDDGVIQIWNLDVEYKFKEDPKLICSTDHLQGIQIKAIATSLNNNRIAVAAVGSVLHFFTYDDNKKQITFDHTIENCHGSKGIHEDMFFNGDGTILYTRGEYSKDVFAWDV